MPITTQPWCVISIFTTLLLVVASIKFNVTVGDDTIKCIESERQALLSFKHGLHDPNGMLFSWRNQSVEDCCNWERVKCSNLTNHIIELDLHGSPDHYLGGNIGPSLLQLSHLNYLDLSYNNFEGVPIPNHIGSIVNLMYLNLSYSKFFGVVPLHLGNLSSLHTLDLHGLFSVRSSKSLEWLSGLSSLQHLDLSGINLENAGDWMQVVNKLPHLKTLILATCKLPSPILPSYPHINISTSLSKLDLSVNHLTSSIFLWLSNFNTSLIHVDLTYNNLQGYIPTTFGNMTSLSYIDFGDNQLEGTSPESFWNFCNLRSLQFSINNLKGTLFEFIQILPSCALHSLQYLNLFHNKFSGPLPDFSTFPNLKVLDLSFNEFSESIPMNLGQLSNLETLHLGHNYLEGIISEAHFSKLTKLQSLDFSHNSLSFHLRSNWVPPFQLDYIDLSSCTLGPKFPHWLQGQKFSYLDISNTSISDFIPDWFWNFSSNLQSLDLSDNKIRAQLPNLPISFTGEEMIYLSSNEFEGQIPLSLSQVYMLDVSNNKFSELTFLCGINTVSPLIFLDLSNNNFSEQLPNCWGNLSNLQILSLASNGFAGGIPSFLSNLSKLISLHLQNNSFSGELPSWLKNYNDLEILDLKGNNLTGAIPEWIGNKLSRLVRLSLRSNQFYGNLPSSLCHLSDILFLDVSLNNITGVVPNCLHNLSSLTANISLSQQGEIFFTGVSYGMKVISEEMTMTWKGRETVMRKESLRLLKSIDFSGNHLTGEIPNGITKLVGLVFLNLSRNDLTGEIPENIGRLKCLDFLDLSRNELVGQIPPTISQISGLGVLDLSYNRLSGKIPIGTQLQSFNASAYMGNHQLCGPPLPKCLEEEMVPDLSNEKDEAGENEFATQGFYVSLVLGFIVGFWGECGTLMLHRLWRHAYFRFLNLEWFE